MNVMLQILTGPEAGRSIEITPQEPLVLGRAEKGNGLISDPKISSTHCRVSWDGQTIHVEDLDSRNGTYVDGEKVTVAHLELGSMFQLGATEILIKRPQEIGKAPIVKPNVRGPLTELIGEYLANFEVLEIISRGENSVVFRARDTENKRTMALKVLLPEFVKRAIEFHFGQRHGDLHVRQVPRDVLVRTEGKLLCAGTQTFPHRNGGFKRTVERFCQPLHLIGADQIVGDGDLEKVVRPVQRLAAAGSFLEIRDQMLDRRDAFFFG